jgi:ribonuclease III
MRSLKKLFTRRKSDGYFFLRIKEITGLKPKNPLIYQLAFRHSSASIRKENHSLINNQRLEFLGDAILDAIVADLLYTNYPTKDEGFLTLSRSKLVSRKKLNKIARKLNLPELIISRLAEHKLSDQILGNALEALIGAVYIDHGYRKCAAFVKNIYENELENPEVFERDVVSYKSLFHEFSQKNKLEVTYVDIGVTGKLHDALYTVHLVVDGHVLGHGRAKSKKLAADLAAKEASKHFNLLENE